MTAVTVDSMAAALGIVATLRSRLSDFRPLWDRIEERVLPEAQKLHWGFGLHHHPLTLKARSARVGYYRHPPASDVNPPKFFYWTGSLQKATTRITERGPTLAKIVPDRNYRGPFAGSSVFSQIVGVRVPEAQIWNRAYIERGIEREMEKWVAEEVAKL